MLPFADFRGFSRIFAQLNLPNSKCVLITHFYAAGIRSVISDGGNVFQSRDRTIEKKKLITNSQMAFGILQIQKIKSWRNLVSSSSHTSRDRETPNANPDVKNIRVIGNSDDPTLETLVRQKIGNQKIRTNAVLAVEMLLGASPDYFRPDNPESGGRYDVERLERWNPHSAPATVTIGNYGYKNNLKV